MPASLSTARTCAAPPFFGVTEVGGPGGGEGASAKTSSMPARFALPAAQAPQVLRTETELLPAGAARENSRAARAPQATFKSAVVPSAKLAASSLGAQAPVPPAGSSSPVAGVPPLENIAVSAPPKGHEAAHPVAGRGHMHVGASRRYGATGESRGAPEATFGRGRTAGAEGGGGGGADGASGGDDPSCGSGGNGGEGSAGGKEG